MKATVEAKYVYEGLVYPPVDIMGEKRRFRVERVETANGMEAEVNDAERATAFRMTRASTVAMADDGSSSPTLSPPAAPTTPAKTILRLAPRPPTQSSAPSTPQKHQTPGKSPRKSSKIDPADDPAFESKILFQKGTTIFAQVGGLDAQISLVKDMVSSVLTDSAGYHRFNLLPPRGILLHGPQGTGKTMLLRAIANSMMDVKSYSIDGRVMGKYMGESESQVRKIFTEAKKNQPSIIFMDEVDSLAPKRGSSEGSEGRVVSTILTEMDALEEIGEDGEPLRVAVVAATNRAGTIDEALRRAGRFEEEIEISVPDAKARREILGLKMGGLPFQGRDEERLGCLERLAGRTHGFVGADLEQLVRFAARVAMKRARAEGRDVVNDTFFRESDFEAALREVKPTALREVSVEVPPVRWADIGGQVEVKKRLQEAVEWPVNNPDAFTRLGITPRKGVLLYGPPGCSKTLTARALATEAGLNFLLIKGPELLNMYVGESERRLRETFRKARAASPAIIFFDEIDSLCAARGSDSSGVGNNMVATLLNEMDGLENLKGVVVVGATNRPEIMDAALMRPGRFDTILYVAPPDRDARREILRIRMGKMKISSDVDLEALANCTEGFSGAEVVSMCEVAGLAAMRENLMAEEVAMRHFEEARGKITPMITREMREFYEEWNVGGGVKKL